MTDNRCFPLARCVTRTSIDSKSCSQEYVYLLGLYLGDGTISVHRRGVYRLRIFLDMKYPKIVAECETALTTVMPGNKVGCFLTATNCFQVSSYSRAWVCLFPQHGPGRKHKRRIWLADWQRELRNAGRRLCSAG